MDKKISKNGYFEEDFRNDIMGLIEREGKELKKWGDDACRSFVNAIKKCRELCVNRFVNGCDDQLPIFKVWSLWLSSLAQTLIQTSEQSALFELGKIVGALDCITISIEGKYKVEEEVTIQLLYKSLESTKHVNEIVLYLYQGPMSQSELAKCLDIERNTLCVLMSKIDEMGIIFTRRMGKYKIYTLSSLGKAFAEYARNKPKKKSIKSAKKNLQGVDANK